MKDMASQRALFLRLPPIVNGDAMLVRRGRFLNIAIGWGIDADLWIVRIRNGQIVEVTSSAEAGSRPSFSLSASAPAWEEFAQIHPRPGYQDILAMIDMRHARVEGDLLAFFSNLLYFKGVFAAARASSVLA